jgi:mgtE-like transporter
MPSREARRDIALVALLAGPLFLFNAVGAHLTAKLLGQASPGVLRMLEVTMGGGVLAVAFVLVVAYYGTVASFRVGVDPDTYGIPIVTSAVDFLGAFALVLAVAAVGLG